MKLAEGDEWSPTGTGASFRRLDDSSGTTWAEGGSQLASFMCVLPLVGSGVNAPSIDLGILDQSCANVVVTSGGADSQIDVSPTRPSEALTVIRAALGTNVTQTAQVLRVTRQTIYAWLADKTELQLSKRIRLEQVRAIAEQWNAQSQSSLRGHLHRKILDQRTLLDILSEEQLGIDDVEKCFEILATAKPKRKSARQWAEEREIGLPSRDDQQLAIDRETSKRLSFD